MAAVHGKTTRVFINGRHLSSEFDSFDLAISADAADGSHFDATSKEYHGGQTASTLTLGGLFSDSAASADEILSAAVGDGTIWCILPAGDAAGRAGYGVVGHNTGHQVMATKDDMARVSASCQGDVAERILSLISLTTVTSSGNGASQDAGASSSAGGSAYLHATAVTGTVAVKVQHSADNNTWADLGAFADVTAIGGQRIAFSGTVNRYTRIAYTLDGGESITLQASIHRE